MRQIAVIALLCLAPLFLAVAAPAWAEGPSFDCAKATTPVEKAICASGDLSTLDKQIAGEYAAAIAAGQTTTADQRAWIAQRDKVCAPENTRECIRQVLLDRHAFLTERPKVTAYESSTKDQGRITISGATYFAEFKAAREDFEAFVAEFNREASQKRDAPRVVKCEQMVVEIPVSRIGSINASVCAVSFRGRLVKAMACYAENDGSSLEISEVGEATVSERDLAVFAGTKC